MAKKKVAAVVKIQIPAGQATPAPPVGTALGPHGVAIMDFCKAYNAQTEAQRGTIVPVEITVFEDRSLHVHHQDAAHAGAPPRGRAAREGQPDPRPRDRSARSPPTQVSEIAETKMPDLNANDIEAAKKQVAGHRPVDGPRGGLTDRRTPDTNERHPPGRTSPGRP